MTSTSSTRYDGDTWDLASSVSQRIVDVLLRALARAIPERIPAAASGTMNNLTIGGIDPRTNEPFAYYETIAGGMGARPSSQAFRAYTLT